MHLLWWDAQAERLREIYGKDFERKNQVSGKEKFCFRFSKPIIEDHNGKTCTEQLTCSSCK